MGILIYVLIGIVWASISTAIHKHKHGNKNVEITFILNALVWWLMMIIAVAKWLAKK